jgi:drug/metabolite transporter (DMT)-like permease
VTGRLGVPTLALLGVGVLAISFAAPLMASLVVPALAIAFWRNALAAAAIAPVAFVRDRAELRTVTRPQVVSVVVAGACLAAHFGFWITSLTMTSVASSTAIVSLQVIWIVGYDLARGAELRSQVIVGVGVAVVGAVVVSGVDLSISPRALAGDGLALLGSIGIAAYAVIGGRVRQTMSTSAYTLGCYGTAAVLLLVATVLSGQALGGYDADQWALLALLAVTAQLLGHSVFNHLLATVSPMVVSLAILLEIPGATLIAAAWLGQVPGATAFAGLALILVGMAVVILAASPSVEGEAVVA